jgi:hypothetical protein
MLRPLVVSVALGVAVLALLGIIENAATWLSASDAALSLAILALTGLVPAKGSAPLAAGLLLLAAVALAATWLIALGTQATGWLAWWNLVFAGIAGGGAILLGLGTVLDRLRSRELV